MERWTGTGVALVTPFDEHLEIDRASLKGLVEYVIAGGVDFLVVLGTTAETATLSAGERAEVAGIVAEVNGGRVPMLAGVGGNNTREVARELAASPWLKDFQGVLSITPCYNKPNQKGLFEHFRELAAVSPLPLCLYNVPGRSGVNLCPGTVARLADECPNIVAVKEASGRFDQATDLVRGRREGFSLLSGDDALTLPLLSVGFDGVISVLANVVPEACVRLVRSAREGRWEEAREMHLGLADLCRELFEEGNPAGVKAALHARGIIRRHALRLPLTPVSGALYERIRESVSR